MAGMLWNQVLVTATFVLPVAAVAALTTGMVQFLLIALVAFAGLLLLSMRFALFAAVLVDGGWRHIEWIHVYYSLLVVAIAAPAILLWQYARRRTLAARYLAGGVAAILALGAPLSWNTAFAIQSRLSRRPVPASTIRAGLNTSFQWMTRAIIERGNHVILSIPLQIAGIADDLTVKSEGLTFTIEAPGGAVWHADKDPGSNVSSTGQLTTLRTVMDESFYQKVKDQPVNLRGYIYLTLYGDRQATKVPFTERLQPVRGLGICSASGGAGAPYFLVCNSAFRTQPDLVSVRFEDTGREPSSFTPGRLASYSPFPAELSLNPLNAYTSYSISKDRLDGVTVMTTEPLAYVRAPVAIDGLKMGAYEVRLK
jgi:hypothetical protein